MTFGIDFGSILGHLWHQNQCFGVNGVGDFICMEF
jgi:hypothetical protein